MMYAINSTNTGFRTIDDIDELLEGETSSLILPVLTVPIFPDVAGFVAAIKAEVGIVAAASITGSALMFAALQLGEWADASALIENALTLGQITTVQHAAIKAAAEAYNVPLSLS